jgi:hypothetical protein
LVKEYEIYLPTTDNDGTPVDPEVVERLKNSLAQAFGGYTHQRSRSEGAWKLGGVVFRDEVTIVRVFDHGGVEFDLRAFKKQVEEELRQESILIVEREVKIFE